MTLTGAISMESLLNFILKLLLVSLLGLLVSIADVAAQDRVENFDLNIKSSDFSAAEEVVIKNINGEVLVTGYDGDEIVIEGRKELWKKRGDISQEEADEYYLETRMYEGKFYVYVEAPNAHVEFRRGKIDYHWHWDDRDWDDINAHFDLVIKVPNNLDLKASTVNSGDVVVEEMTGRVRASNVNGNVVIKDALGAADANTVNGDIEVWFSESPTEDLDFHTVNGKIEVYSPEDLSAVITFESLHGELYTDFEDVKRLPNRLNKEKKGSGYRYKISQSSPIQIGDGEIEMAFEMVNGDAYIRVRKS
ncbi:MAG: hypothetical protein ED557_02945 [Balneola sp.]|nr:MAG: hypothetical protein ED557_02945 [Balneola sp.]